MKKPVIAKRRNRVTVCSQKDVVIKNGIRIFRKGIFDGWAAISAKKASRFSRDGYSIDLPAQKITHEIVMSYNPDILISEAAWIYDKRLKSPPRWFRIVNVDDDSQFWYFECQIVESSDDAIMPVEGADRQSMFKPLPLPDSVKL